VVSRCVLHAVIGVIDSTLIQALMDGSGLSSQPLPPGGLSSDSASWSND